MHVLYACPLHMNVHVLDDVFEVQLNPVNTKSLTTKFWLTWKQQLALNAPSSPKCSDET